ncbi:MAG: hypothetical protein K2P20_04090 [Oscillospiraceae bacterium]|nr:hypothetical protein [Oscillospiraceae bacterium]
METQVIHKTEIIGGKEYPLTVTKYKGIQEIVVAGKPVVVEAVTIFESPLGTSRCFTRARPEASPEERAAGRQLIRETATRAMIDLGIW